MNEEQARALWAAMSPEQRERFGAFVRDAAPLIRRMCALVEAYVEAGIDAAEQHANAEWLA